MLAVCFGECNYASVANVKYYLYVKASVNIILFHLVKFDSIKNQKIKLCFFFFYYSCTNTGVQTIVDHLF